MVPLQGSTVTTVFSWSDYQDADTVISAPATNVGVLTFGAFGRTTKMRVPITVTGGLVTIFVVRPPFDHTGASSDTRMPVTVIRFLSTSLSGTHPFRGRNFHRDGHEARQHAAVEGGHEGERLSVGVDECDAVSRLAQRHFLLATSGGARDGHLLAEHQERDLPSATVELG